MALAVDAITAREQALVDELVQDYFRYGLLRHRYLWSPTTKATHQPDVCAALRSLSDDYLTKFRENIILILDRFDLVSDHMDDSFNSVLDTMFEEGISWEAIVASFVFTVELAYFLLVNHLATDECIDRTSQWLTAYTVERVVPWVRAQNGWEGLIRLSAESTAAIQRRSSCVNIARWLRRQR